MNNIIENLISYKANIIKTYYRMLTFTVYDNKCNSEITIYLGQSAEENWKLIDQSNQNDLWFHLADHPSSHVVINIPEKTKISNNTIKYAAVLCKEHSKLSNLKKVTVIYTNIKNVSKADKPGSVYTKKITKIIV